MEEMTLCIWLNVRQIRLGENEVELSAIINDNSGTWESYRTGLKAIYVDFEASSMQMANYKPPEQN